MTHPLGFEFARYGVTGSLGLAPATLPSLGVSSLTSPGARYPAALGAFRGGVERFCKFARLSGCLPGLSGVAVEPSSFTASGMPERLSPQTRSMLTRTALLAGLVLAAGLFLSAPAYADPSPMISSQRGHYETSTVSRSGLASIARRYVGMTGPQLGFPSRLWCADFASMVRRKAGLRAPASRRAIDQARYGKRITRPVPGALLISGRRGGAHVDVIVAVHADGTVTMIGGNVSKRVVERRRVPRGIIVFPT